jgi:hypothetical protein
MRHARNSPLFAVIALAIGFASSTAQAGIVTQTVSTGDPQKTDFNAVLSVRAFDTSLGTLQSVTVQIDDEAFVNGTLTNNSASAATFNIAARVVFGVSFGGNSLVSDILSRSQSNILLNPSAQTIFGPFALTGSSGPIEVDPSLLSQFIGTSNLSFNFGTSSNVQTSGYGGNVSSSFTTTADSTLTVIYTYTSPNVVPEPASLAMTAIGGLLAAGFTRRRFRSRR